MTKQLQEGQARPFLKWAGGKSQLLPEIRKVYPEGLSPFWGAARCCWIF